MQFLQFSYEVFQIFDNSQASGAPRIPYDADVIKNPLSTRYFHPQNFCQLFSGIFTSFSAAIVVKNIIFPDKYESI